MPWDHDDEGPFYTPAELEQIAADADFSAVVWLCQEVARLRPGWWPFEVHWDAYMPAYNIRFCYRDGQNWVSVRAPFTLEHILGYIDSPAGA
jgi:hypothetical protein